MTINHQLKTPMDAADTLASPATSQGARRATGDAAGPAAPAWQPGVDMEVVPRARRRHFSNADKRRILQAAALGYARARKHGFIDGN